MRLKDAFSELSAYWVRWPSVASVWKAPDSSDAFRLKSSFALARISSRICVVVGVPSAVLCSGGSNGVGEWKVDNALLNVARAATRRPLLAKAS